MTCRFPDYQNCGLNVISSIVRYFGAENRHTTLPALDRLLEGKAYRNIVLFLLDGLGMDALAHDCPPDSFFNSHIFRELSAVYPSTTTAATTSIETDYAPGEHGWLGWTLYFHEIDQLVDIFLNCVSGKQVPAADYSVADTYLPLHPVFDRINGTGCVKAADISPFGVPPYPGLQEMHDALVQGCREPGQHFYYAYWVDPDKTMHQYGVYSDEVCRKIRDLEAYIRQLSSELPDDTLLLVTADHGLIDAEHLYITDHPALAETLLRPACVEPRATVFYVKPEFLHVFPQRFREAFPDGFTLMTAEEFRASKILGPGEYTGKISDLTGDFVAVSRTAGCLDYARKDHPLKGVHAGLTEIEMRVPLILAKR